MYGMQIKTKTKTHKVQADVRHPKLGWVGRTRTLLLRSKRFVSEIQQGMDVC